MINITFEDFIKLRPRTMIDISCDYCGKTFQRSKIKLYRSSKKLILTLNGFNKKKYCSKKCSFESQIKPKIKKTCYCGKVFECSSNRPTTFCSYKCSNSAGRNQSIETKNKISKSIENYRKLNPITPKKIICSICKKEFFTKHRKTCSKECAHSSFVLAGMNGGRKSAAKLIRRSKSEIILFDLLSSKYECLSNEPMFNGWDADIIIPKLKLAILWNGIWHYSKVRNGHSVLQVQTRDFIKLKEIEKCGYNFIIVKDYKNKMTPFKAFQSIEQCLLDNQINITLI